MSERGRLWLFRVLALAIALGLWFRVSLEDRDAYRERTVEASVTFKKPEDILVLGSVEPVQVQVRGPARELDQLAPFMVQVVVELAAQTPGILDLALSPEDVELPSNLDLEVRSVEPNRLTLEIDRQMRKMLVLKASFTGEPAAGARVLRDEVQIVPARAEVVGPAKDLSDLESLDLTPINLDGHALDFEETASVIAPENVQITQNPRVTVRVPMSDVFESASTPPDSSTDIDGD